MTSFPDDPMAQGSISDLQNDARKAAEEAAAQLEAETREAEAAAIEREINKGKKSDGDVTGADETYISSKDLEFLNGK